MAADERVATDWVQEPLAVAGWPFPEYLKRAKLSHEAAAEELELEPVQLRNYLYRRTVPHAIYKRITFKRGLLGMKKPEVITMRAPFRLPKSYRAWAGAEALDFDKLTKEAETPAPTNGVKSTPLTRATPEQRKEWMSRAVETRRQRRLAQASAAAPAAVPDTEPPAPVHAPSFSAPVPQAVAANPAEIWSQVYVSTLGYMTQQVTQQALEIERLRQQVAGERAEKQRVQRLHQELHGEYLKLQQDLETAEQLLGERGPVTADAPPTVVSAVQSAVATGVAAAQVQVSGQEIFDSLAERISPVAQVEAALPK